METKDYNPFTTAQAQFDGVAELLGLDKGTNS
jgi:hypothetical protein